MGAGYSVVHHGSTVSCSSSASTSARNRPGRRITAGRRIASPLPTTSSLKITRYVLAVSGRPLNRSVRICPHVLRICSHAGYSNRPPHGSHGEPPVSALHGVFVRDRIPMYEKSSPILRQDHASRMEHGQVQTPGPSPKAIWSLIEWTNSPLCDASESRI